VTGSLITDWSAGPDSGVDLISPDGRIVVEVKRGGQGLRDLRAGVMQLASWIDRAPHVEQALLAIEMPRLSVSRAKEVWHEARSVLRPDIAHRLALAVLTPKERWVDPPTPELMSISAALFDDWAANRGPDGARTVDSPMFYEIVKVLLDAWLRRQEPLRVHEIMARAGCSHPSVSSAIDELSRRGEVERTRDRRVTFATLPRRTLEELVVRSNSLRGTIWVEDVSGKRTDPGALLRRVEKAKLPPVAIGGVLAARHYDPSFNLQGLPRLDLTLWVPRTSNARWRSDAIYPGLESSSTPRPDAVMAVHRLTRAQSLFESGPTTDTSLPYADPVETLLDLHELRLDEQAQALVTKLRESNA